MKHLNFYCLMKTLLLLYFEKGKKKNKNKIKQFLFDKRREKTIED